MIATHILATVEAGRLQKAVDGFVSGAYRITVASQSGTEIRGFVTNGDNKECGVILSQDHVFCSCPDAMYHKRICKHATALALFVIRYPQAGRKEEATPNLKLGKVRRDWQAAA